ncbi:MAG: hypothetical protein WC753_03345 [Candidatus Gracilibacteria bacterium]|jgi:hypothetical protein
MKNIQIILIIAILILVYLISMQWIGDRNISDTQKVVITPRTSVTETQLPPAVTLPAVETIKDTQPVTDTSTVTPPPATTPTADITTPLDISKLIEYKNSNFGYHFSMPKKVYYAGFGARDGAVHTVAIQSDMVPEVFETALVRVFFYGKKILPELKSTTRYVDPNGKYILLLIDGAYSVRIESDNLKSATVQAIEATIGVD